jgi:enoyl-CoA hydratase
MADDARMTTPSVRTDRDGPVLTVVIDRPAVRNAVDGPTAAALAAAFRAFDTDAGLSVAVLTGAGGVFCAGADLTSIAPDSDRAPHVAPDGDAPLGVSRLMLGKPVIAAIEGHAVAGGLELALWCDLRVASQTAVLGVFCRRFGVPLIDGGTVRLPRIVGQGRALDLILTGRAVEGTEALAIGLVDRLVPEGQSLEAAQRLAHELADLPQTCMRSDRLSVHEQWSLSTEDALRNETAHGMRVIASGETLAGAERFRSGGGRHGSAL